MRRKLALAITADGEVDLIRGMIDLLRSKLDRVLLVEGRRTFHGKPREVLGGEFGGHAEAPPHFVGELGVKLRQELLAAFPQIGRAHV